MATEYLFSNNATTTLAQSVSATATVLNVASGDGDLFPSPSSGQAFAITLVDAATGLTNEICYCTSRSGDQLTVTRGQEGTNAVAWSAGDTCANYITADVMESWLQESDLNGYATQSWAEDLFVQQGNGGNTSNSGVTYAWIDLVTESAYPRLGVTAANGNTYGFYGIAKVNALIGGCIQNTNPGITGALAGTSLCVNPADGLPYLAYNGNTEIAALALDSAKVDKTTGSMSALDVEISGGYLKMTNTAAPGYATWFRDSDTATDGVLDLYSNVGGSDTNVMRITADGGINILGSGTFQKDGADVALKTDLPLPEGMHCQIFSEAIPNPCPEEGWLVDIPTGWATHSFVTACDTGTNVYAVSAKVENATQARLWAKYPTNGAWAAGGEVTVTSYGYYSS